MDSLLWFLKRWARGWSLALLGIFLVFQPRAWGQSSGDSHWKFVEFFIKVLGVVRQHYVEEVPFSRLIQGAIKGLLSELDPYSVYLDPEKFQDFKAETSGEFAGIGVEITVKDGVATILSVFDDSPAAKMGLKPLDRILAIDGQSTRGMNLLEVSRKLKGKVGQKVTLLIQRDSQPIFEVTLLRDNIKVKSVTWKLWDNVLYVKISKFIETTARDFEKVLRQHQNSQQWQIQALIIDLRQNPGGLFDQAVKVADLFVPAGQLIVATKGRQESENTQTFATQRQKYGGIPILILVDRTSASASEIVAGCLQDHQLALLIGQPTFGKGSVQSVIRLDPHGAIKLTVARYFLPKGRSLYPQGIKPDILVEPSKDSSEDVVLQQALHYSKMFTYMKHLGYHASP